MSGAQPLSLSVRNIHIMGSQTSAILQNNNLLIHKIIMVLLLTCTLESNTDDLLPSSNHYSSVPLSLMQLPFDGHLSFHNLHFAAQDFGGLFSSLPLAVLYPRSVSDISLAVSHVFQLGPSSDLKVAARGHGHSLQGQAQAPGGLIISMESLQKPKMRVFTGKTPFVEVPGGELWINILHETLKYGLAPSSWTDYLHLTVGGTLSNGGISGQAFRHGPQINNVYQLEVVTGKGEVFTCSEKQNSDLFHGVLGGLGQFGIITSARISLEPAAKKVKWIRVLYHDFSSFSKDQEQLISLEGAFDYIEGFVMVNRTGLLNNWRSSFNPKDPVQASQFNSEGKTLYCLELAKYFDPDVDEPVDGEIERLLGNLGYISSTLFMSEVSLLEFLDRVHVSELKLRESGLWEVPHPWLNLLVPKSEIDDFAREVFGNILTGNSNGPILIYPVNKSKWNRQTSLVTPREDIFYLVAFLSSAMPFSTEKDGLEQILARNQNIMDYCKAKLPGTNQYLPQYNKQEDWEAHYGSRWEVFMRRKLKYDPLAILSPGQRIFRNKIQVT
ncbi:hypothetical protein SAY86_018330 [Trapa natans]|uniref:cytokinin dehydrogenase n=1 Tax=Trapa natans TaxID=22666 RepID=A0AAN7QYQ0_TRANT|nr:hypothetical protein SAY86_018330 [Trapa natans]